MDIQGDDSEVARRRDVSYRTENPSIIHYKYILEGTKEDEIRIHNYLKNYRYIGKEWFKLDPFVINFIESVNNIGDIRSIVGTHKVFTRREKRELSTNNPDKMRILNISIKTILEKLYPNVEKYSEEYTGLYEFFNSTLKILPKENIIDTVLKTWGIQVNITSIDVSKFNLSGNFMNRMKFVISYLDDHPEEFDNLFSLLSFEYEIYYVTLGPDRCKALFYRRDRLELELKKTINNQTIDPSIQIYQEFKEGGKHSRLYIKEKLKEIYSSIGLKKVAKASDLEEWFDVKLIKIMDGEKRVGGFELLKKKKGD